MVFVLIGIALGILLVAILMVKVFKTSSHDIVGMDIRCRKCGIKTNGLTCTKCEKKSQSFGVNFSPFFIKVSLEHALA